MDFNLSQTHQRMVNAVKEFCDREIEPLGDSILENNEVSAEMLPKFARLGILGAVIPENYGGVGLTNLHVALISEQLGKTGTSLFWPLSMNNSTAETIYHFGSDI